MRIFFILLLFLGSISEIKAQKSSADKTFERAKELASAGDYDLAIKLIESLHDSLPQNKSYRLYLARVHGWNKDYSAAIDMLVPMVQSKDFSEEAIKVMVTTQLWAENYEEVIKYSTRALTKYQDPYFQMHKARALEALGLDEEAKAILQDVIMQDSGNKAALELQVKIFKKNKEHISLSYLNTTFSAPSFQPWHLAYLEYKKDTGKIPLVARLNYGTLYGADGTLLEADAYPKIGENSYFYLNIGAKINGPIFPEFKGSIEYFQSLNDHFVISLGGRYLNFTDAEVVLLNAGITYIWNKLRINYKPYFTSTKSEWFSSHSLAVRIINPVKETFLQVDFQYGSVPYAVQTSSAFTEVSSLRVGLQYHFRITENVLLQPVFMYEYEEYFPDEYRNKFSSQIITFFRF